MKQHKTLVAVAVGALAWSASAQLRFAYDAAPFPLLVPDNDPNGTSDTRVVSTACRLILGVRVTLDVSGWGEGAFNGDLFITLLHDTGYSVLLNRVGSRSGRPLGYGDGGFNSVTFADAASLGDVHAYRLTLNGSHTVPLGGSLTGRWQPDGRETDPGLALLSDSRSAMLGRFTGLDPNGAWTLFLADLAPGGKSQLNGWKLDITVPEPAGASVLAALAMLSGALVFRRLRSPSRSLV